MRSVCVVTDKEVTSDWEKDFLLRQLVSAGSSPGEISWTSADRELPQANVFLLLGEPVLRSLTGKQGIDKWQASILFERGRKVIPCYDLIRVKQDMTNQVWVSICAQKAAKESETTLLKETNYAFLLNPPLAETLDYLNDRVRTAEFLSVDIETGRGQINTVGFAVSPREAIAINVLPDRLGADSFWRIWTAICRILESAQPKLLQNFIYETLFFSRYGIRLQGVAHDTMLAQKFLWPELEMGLDAIGRMYTEQPYWKEDGKSWNDIRDWEAHYRYNCLDTCGTFAGYLGQRADFESRRLSSLHDGFLRRIYPAITEMCCNGLPVDEARLVKLRNEVSGELSTVTLALSKQLGCEKLNPNSPAQVKEMFRAKGYTIPKKYDSKTKSYKESTDEKSLKKLRMKHPEDQSVSLLLRYAKYETIKSSYLSFSYDQDKAMRYQITALATKTWRMAGYQDPWGNGVNPQTIPDGKKGISVKQVFAVPPDEILFAVDLKAAESRFVAYDAPDLNLIRALEDPSRDIHSEVAAEICLKLGKDPKKEQADKGNWKKLWRNLGKKSGHGANYSMKELTFIDTCINEMDIVFSKAEATGILEAYHTLFPGIRQWHAKIRAELRQNRMLKNPIGWERYFYGRMDDDTFRDAYSWRPQSTIPAITNHLMLFLLDERAKGNLNFSLLLQCHDSLLLRTRPDEVPRLAEACEGTQNWHPKIDLPGGRLVIPVECEYGINWGEMQPWKK